MGLSRVGMGSGVTVSRHDGSLTFFVSLSPLPFFVSLSPLPFFSFLFFFFPSFLAFPFGFGVLLTAGFSSFFFFFFFFLTYIYIYIKVFMGFENSWAGRMG